MKLFCPRCIAVYLIIGFAQQANAALECKKIEFAELQSFNKHDLQVEYCVAQISFNGLMKQTDLALERERLISERASLDRMTGDRPKQYPSVGSTLEELSSARGNCVDQIERIRRIATQKKLKLKCQD